MDIAALAAELATGHPDTGAYSADDATAAAELNAVNRGLPKNSLTGDELFTATVAADFAGLSDAQRLLWVGWCNTDRDPFNAANVAFVTYIFGDGSDTLAALGALRDRPVSRAVELWLGLVRVGNVQEARP